MHERRPSTNSNYSNHEMGTPVRRQSEPSDSSTSPSISRYGRSHKLKMQDDFVSTDKKVSAYLKLSPGNQMQYFSTQKEPRKKLSPKKLDRENPDGTPRRGRPPKSPSKDKSGNDTFKVTVKVEPQDPAAQVDGCEWMVGDLAWARVGGHPFWPCVIALDPVLKIFTKTVRKGRTLVSQRMVHVQFFGDNGRRSWLNTTAIMSFNGRDAFIQLGDTILAGMRKKEPKQTSAFVIKPAVVQVWEKAVQEAEDLANATREERIEFFTKNFPPIPIFAFTREQLIEKALGLSEPLPQKRGRKRKAELSPVDENFKKKQIKLEEDSKDGNKSEEPAVENSNKEESPLLSSTPRTIADRKKRQALLMQLARSNQNSSASPAPVVSPSARPEADYPSPVPPKPPVIKRLTVKESSPEIADKKKLKKTYTKNKKPNNFQESSHKQIDQVVTSNANLNYKEVNTILLNKLNKAEEEQKLRRKSKNTGKEKKECEEKDDILEDAVIDSKVSTVMEVDEDIRSSKSNSPTPQACASQKTTLAKRINGKSLFSGAKAEKICQICEKTGETVRCRGPCQGYYHPECITNPPKPQEVATPGKKGRRGRPKKSIESSPVSSDTSQPEEQLENGRINIKVEVTKEEKIEVNGFFEQSTTLPKVEVIEPEVKLSTKMRKGSKDSDSAEENEGFRCKDCSEGRSQPCFVCHEYIEKKTGEAKLYRCITAYCGKVYHEECLKPWPQSQWRTNGNGKSCERGVMTCPQHTCHTCASDNPGVIKARYSNDKLVRCVRCPTTYHYGNYCVPAGSEILTNSQIICPQHYQPQRKGMIHHVNAAWCFICASGGSLICCDLCPTSFHADCLKIKLPADGSYVCEDCLTGRFPLYGEIVWVKLGTYRWWPAEILYPVMIPENILNLPHVRGEFAVKFFGSHDHYWVNRGRVFLYQDGDTAGKGNYKKSSVDNMFEKAVIEASVAQRKYIEEKATREAESRPGMKPPNYVKLKSNRPVGNVRTMEMNLSNLSPCECDPKSDNPCAPESDCLNRILMVECNPLVCPAGEKCCNQLFEKRLYPPLQPYQTPERGWGLKTLVNLKKGDFVIEYVGEMIDEDEYKRRVIQMHENNEENFYFLTIDKDRMLDAGPKGNVARFMNHSCQPNCETQKWTVNGDTRVGLFALCDIPANAELVFNYNLESTGSDKKPCMCGAPNCSGFIGLKANKTNKEEKEDAKEKRVVKKKKSIVTKNHEEVCFVCGKRGELLRCDGKYCIKGYHLTCLNKKQRPQGYWLCPWHQCTICNKGRVQRCSLCVNSYCQEHIEGNIRPDQVGGFICFKHDQINDQDAVSEPNQVLINELSKTTNKNKDIVEPMDVEEESSKDAVTLPGLTPANIPGSTELINNNVIKTINLADRRSKRSSSYSGGKLNSDLMVNGNIKKTYRRRNRPSSVDDKLITSFNQENCRESSVHSDISAIINEVITNLPIKEEIEDIKKDAKLQEINENNVLEPILVKEISTNFAETESNVKTCEIKNNTVINEATLEFEIEPELYNSQQNTEINPTAEDSISQDQESKTENCAFKSLKDNDITEIGPNNPSNTVNVELLKTSAPENNEHTNTNDISDEIKVNSIVEMSSEPNRSDTFIETMERENKNESVELISKTSFEQLSCTDKTPKTSLLEITESPNNQNTENKQSENKSPGMMMQGCEDHVDDFELSYSECSNDKPYKSVNDSESSLEMKLTGCTSEEDKSIVNSLEEIQNNSELSNCIEKSNPMEVA